MKKNTKSRRQFVLESFIYSSGIYFSGFTLLSGCKGKNPTTSNPPPSKDFAMQAAWVNDAEFTGYFVAMAEENNFYEEEGLNLIYLPGGPDVIPEGTLLARKADLALTTPDTTVNLILKEKAPFKIIGAQYQKSPLGVVSLEENQINEPKDLIGKTLAVPSVNVLSVEAMLNLNGISKDDVNIVPYLYDPLPLVNGEVDATIDFVTNVPFSISQLGKKASSFLLYEKGFTIFNDTVVVMEDTLLNRKNEIKAWFKASRKGWEIAFNNYEKYLKTFMTSYFKGTGRSLENEIFFFKEQKDLVQTESGVFVMSEEDIEKNILALKSIGLEASRDMFITDLLDEVIEEEKAEMLVH